MSTNTNSQNTINEELERLRNENADLKERLSRLNQLFQSTTIGIYRTNPEGEVLQANNPLIKMLGYESLEEMQQYNLENDKLILSYNRSIFKSRINNEGIIIGNETQWLKKNGESIHIRESARAIKDSSGRVILYEGTVEDITAQKQKEIELKESEEKYRKLVELLPNGVIIHKDGKIVYVNDVVVKTVKAKNRESLVGKDIFQYIRKDYHHIVLERLQNIIENISTAELREEIYLTESGKEINVEACTVPFEMKGGTYYLTVVTDVTEKKIAEKELRLSEITYRGMLNSISEAIFIQEEDGTFVDVNQAAEKYYKFEHNYFIGRSPMHLSADERNDMIIINEQIKKAFHGNPQVLEFWGKKSDGTVFPTEVSMVSGLYFDKKVVIAVVRDITDRMNYENLIIESEKKYRQLIDFAVGGIMMGSPDGTIIEANSQMCKLLGRSRNDIIGKNISDGFFTKASLEKSPLRYDKLKQGFHIIKEREISRPDGSVIPIEMHSKMMPDFTYQSIYHDISERKNTEKIILESKELAEKLNSDKEALLKSMPDMVFTINHEGIIIDFYSNSHNLLLIPPSEFLNKSVKQVLPQEISQKIEPRIISVLKTKEMERFSYELLIDNMVAHFDAKMVYINPQTVLAVVRDITERMMLISELQNAKLKAEESDRLKSAFLANMSHEIRTPMNSILGFTDLLKENETDKDKKEYLGIIENSCNLLMGIINDIIEISKIEAGIIKISKEQINVNHLLKAIHSEMSAVIPKTRNIQLTFSENNPVDKITIFSDTIKLKQILTNLINNALKFTEEGYVEVGFCIKNNDIEFFVKDSGIGISEKDIEIIFDRFVQVKNKFSSSNAGSGLGLSICKAYAEMLGGDMYVTSEINQGSCFFLTLPLISQ
ncbi:MAG TPA: PAS domain S-box protein [Bacteroidales bacterium]|mgnify:CR=1 FL=1|nr:PAS domain S-box protein [Bacteroidales bacterium]